MLGDRTPLHVFERGSVTDVRYRDEVLKPYGCLFRNTWGPEFILMDDNAKPRRALLVDEYLESDDIHHMDWPARSPDLNPIEHVWDALMTAIATHNPPPSGNHPGNENSIAERMGAIATRTHKLSYFNLGHQSLPPTNLGRVDEEMASLGGRPLQSYDQLK
ncbi:DDE_3 domain-containing protein [Trichonephila clavipes]|nr:DDE_3 domain-containing protein [Trichonephila clavipes]